MGEDDTVSPRRGVVAAALLAAALVTACGGGGQSDEERAAVVEMLERLGRGPRLAQCMAEQFDGEVSVAELQTVIDARGDFTNVNFELVETIVVAEQDCSEEQS